MAAPTKPRKIKQNPSKPLIKLAVDWANDRVTTGDALGRLGVSQGSQARYKIAAALRDGVRNGLVDVRWGGSPGEPDAEVAG